MAAVESDTGVMRDLLGKLLKVFIAFIDGFYVGANRAISGFEKMPFAVCRLPFAVCRLPFAVVLVLILRKSVKSLQNVVNEAMAWLMVEPVTASAFSQARYKLQHTAFIELNQRAVVESRYQDADFRTF